MKWLREEAKGEEMENTREPLRRPPYVAQVVETVDHFLLFDTISPRGIVSSVLDPIERGLIMASYVNFEPANRRAACRCRVAERGARQAGRRAAPLSAERPHDAASPRSPPGYAGLLLACSRS